MRDAPNRNNSAVFAAHSKVPDWLREAMEGLTRGYLFEKERQEKRGTKKPFPWEVKAQIATLKKAEEIFEKGNRMYAFFDGPSRHFNLMPAAEVQGDPVLQAECRQNRHNRRALAQRKLTILNLRRERRRLALWLVPAPRGAQMNYMLDYSAWCLAERIKEKTGRYNWELVASMLSEYLPIGTMSANQALKAHRRFRDLRNDREKFQLVVYTNRLNNNWFGRTRRKQP